MRSYSYLFAGLIVFLVVGAMGSLFMGAKNTPVPSISVQPTPITDITVPPTEAIEDIPLMPGINGTGLMLNLWSPREGSIIKSPLVIEGEARGTWYFEASFPVKLVDADGNIIVQTHAQAQGEWMTENFVPFTSILTWATSSVTTATGTLILMRDNPSGLPEHDAQIEIPVTF
jgi:hypothetical protein